jgi:hypothetical protein
VGVVDSWNVFYLSIKFAFAVVLRLFSVPGFNFLICSSLSIKSSSAFLLPDYEFTVKDIALEITIQNKLTLNFICLGKQTTKKRIVRVFVLCTSVSV